MTKTEEYLKILAEGGDAPTDCCMTQTQSLIAQAIDRINNLGGGTILPLTDYLDTTGVIRITDLDGIEQAIEEGKGFYLDFGNGAAGSIQSGLYDGVLSDTEIILTSAPFFSKMGSTYVLGQVQFHFDRDTGATNANTHALIHPFPNIVSDGGGTNILTQAPLTITVGSQTYTYDGTQAVNITIADGENMGF
jgi:hypothetical protein